MKQRHATSLSGPLVEINITPLTDVILVLLIIFMVATPLLYQSDVKIVLPKMSKTSDTAESPSRLRVSVDSSGTAILDGKRFNIRQDSRSLETAFASLVSAQKADVVLVINADRTCTYDDVMRTIDAAKSSGIKRISLGVQKK